MHYAGIGARSTPEDVLGKMRKAAEFLAKRDIILRSGGARGADSAFEQGADSSGGKRVKQIFLPFVGFNRRFPNGEDVFCILSKDARNLAKKYHPNWKVLGARGRDFMSRNSLQILGPNLNDPVEFVLCWTPDGKTVGGTGQAIRMAQDLNIPVLNFGSSSDNYISDYLISL